MLLDSQVGEEGGLLGAIPYQAFGVLATDPGHVHTADLDSALRGNHLVYDRLDKGCFLSGVGAEQGDELTRLHMERHAGEIGPLNKVKPTVLIAEVVDVDPLLDGCCLAGFFVCRLLAIEISSEGSFDPFNLFELDHKDQGRPEG